MGKPKTSPIQPNIGMVHTLGDHIKCASPDCNIRHDCYHYTREFEEHMTCIMPMNTGIDCVDFEPVEEE